ncbi:hypothetical protein CA13_35490 [Planctomycetes bacterium CA13]|uniref:Glycoside hydrolase family 42 N-terminal domain-containing protein n=1 Tax=Novipirellula herctigrandis TaxID=2527986 RepID=A0A5C5Z3X6_9BACT|nr:hypothetical protein CA13_35490 [Planctomycetes bacterium CA13]
MPFSQLRHKLRIVAFLFATITPQYCSAEWVWIEGESATESNASRHPWYADVKNELLSGGDFLSHFNDQDAAEIEYKIDVPAAGKYEFWMRANPVRTRLSYKLEDSDTAATDWKEIDVSDSSIGNVNIASDNKPDLRFLAWAHVGAFDLPKGAVTLRFRIDSELSNHGSIDCMILTTERFIPQGIFKPDEIEKAIQTAAKENEGWVPLRPKHDPFDNSALLDLRFLNESVAGEGGYISVKDGEFVHQRTAEPIRFWAVNGPASKDVDGLRREAKLLAKRGVNLVRVHGGYFDNSGNVKMEAITHAHEVVDAMKAEGIYSHFSIYFPLWLTPPADSEWLDGYDGKQYPFASLMFNPKFQATYRQWWKALLLTPNAHTGKRLIDDPALAGLEIQNEDSFLFWTFDAKNIPDPQLRILESQFADWLITRYESLDATKKQWKDIASPRDAFDEGRVGFRGLWNIVNDKTLRDKDTVRFLVETQRSFYEQTYRFLRELGFKGVITASNWATADAEVLGPLEKYTYTVTDFIDRHGYFGCQNRGDNSAWSIRDGHTYVDRSALRFEPENPKGENATQQKQFVHPVMDPKYDGMPSMISETAWNRPNRYRSEAPLYLAVYGSLQAGNGIVHFAQDGSQWAVKPGFFMQPWTLMSPATMGQFPAAAMIYRHRLVTPGAVLAEINLEVESLLHLQGTPLPQGASFDVLRLADVPKGTDIKSGNVIDPLIHYAGRTVVNFVDQPTKSRMARLDELINRDKQTVISSTREVLLNYGKGILFVNAPAAQAVSGMLSDAGDVSLRDIVVGSEMELGHIALVSLDAKPISNSQKMLLQVMSEEKNNQFRSTPVGDGTRRIESIGQDPWLFRNLSGYVKLKRVDAKQMQVIALDANGYAVEKLGTADNIQLRPDTMYYLIQQ